MLDLAAGIQRGAREVYAQIMMNVIAAESEGNPYAIGVVGGQLERRPRSKLEAIATVEALERDGWNYSASRFGLTTHSAFEPCKTLQVGAAILKEWYVAAKSGRLMNVERQCAIRDALSCYNSASYIRDYRLCYVQKVGSAKPVPPANRKKGVERPYGASTMKDKVCIT